MRHVPGPNLRKGPQAGGADLQRLKDVPRGGEGVCVRSDAKIGPGTHRHHQKLPKAIKTLLEEGLLRNLRS